MSDRPPSARRAGQRQADRERPLAVVLLSGGMDSAVAAAEVARSHRLACLHASYGQRTMNRERVCFGALAHHFEAEQRLVISLDHLASMGGSALTDATIPVPEAPVADGTIPDTYVPFRNAHLLAAGVSWAEVLGATAVVIGAVEDDSSGYPDCRRVFYQAFESAVRLGTRPESDISLHTPVIDMSKSEIVRRGLELGLPFHLTWSCYQDESRACGRCDSCRLRLKGFAQAGAEDPLPYAEATGEPQVPPPADTATGSGTTAVGEPLPASPPARERRLRALRSFLSRVKSS